MDSPEPAPHSVFIVPCIRASPVFRVLARDFLSPNVPTACGHVAWADEVIVLPDGAIAHRLHNAHCEVRSTLLSLAAPKRFPPPYTAWCTACRLGERLTRAIICAWCRKIIFPLDYAVIAHDDSPTIPLYDLYRTRYLWDRRLVVVCGRTSCASRVYTQMHGDHAYEAVSGYWDGYSGTLISLVP